MPSASRLVSSAVAVFLLSLTLPVVAARGAEAPAERPPQPPSGEPEPPAVLAKGYLPDRFGDREITYARVTMPDGEVAMIEGDILVHPTQEKPAPTIVAFRRSLWPGGIIPYVYSSGFSNVANVRAAMLAVEAATPIRFVPRTTQAGYLVFKNHAASNQGSSEVGFGGGAQDIYIGTALSVGTTTHELGHAIGLDHEHNSPVRNQFVQVVTANVQSGLEHNFDIASFSSSAVLRPYDFVSIMHYGPTTFGKPIGGGPARQTTLRRVDGMPGPLGNTGVLTAHDIAGIEAMYGPFAFMTHAAGGWPLSGKSCMNVGPDPYKYPAFQAKTGATVFCVDKPTWLWSNVGLKDPRLAGLPPDSYRCLEIYEPGDADFSRQPNYVCYPSATPMILSWSDSGPRPGMKCVLFHAPEAGSAWDNDYLCYYNATAGAIGEVIRDAQGRCLEIDGGGRAVVTACGTLRWRRQDVSIGSVGPFLYEPKDYFGDYSPRCLTAGRPGDPVTLQPCGGGSAQDFLVLGGGEIRIGGYCLQVAASGAVYTNSCTGATDQQWVMRRTATSPY